MQEKKKISQLPPKGANLANTDLLMISQTTTDGYESKSITGAEIITSAQEGRQATLVSGTNIKTVNDTSLLGSGNVSVQPTLVSGTNIKTIEGQSLLGSGNIDLTKSDVGLANVDNTSDASKPISTATQTALNGKQDTLVSGTNIKTVNSTSLLGSGNVSVQPTLVSGTNIKTINGNSLLGSGDLVISGGGGLTIGTTAITSGTIGRLLFEGTGNVIQESANLFWDNTNGRLGIGTSSPNMSLDIRTGNVGIGVTSNAGFKLDVNGTARVSGAITLTDSSAGIVGSAQGVSIGSAYWTSFVYGGSTVHRLASNAYGLNSYIGNNIAFGYNPTGSTPASAKIEIGAGTATAGTAPLKLRAGTNLTTPENGAFEFDGTNLYFTVGGVRKTINLI